ncbi:hypothetical protein PR048_010481 [Dryococelus australis]|uniref:Reverse transcriptase RNase H-like domain-containing protein n=1 Tax=Dryococelus australis TaxID=614101 RepID=A0ABQ9I2V1_9NEOP|nr:hypothetical protein PR048_010481 [Dryococelus australis]
MYESRALNETEKKYAQIEKDAHAITLAYEKFHDYNLGSKVTILTDHKPLVLLLQSKPLADLTATLQRLRIHTLLRTPVSPLENNSDAEKEELFIQSVTSHTPFSDTRLEEIRMVQEMDAECGLLKKQIVEGFGDNNALFWAHRGQLSYANGLIMHGSKICPLTGDAAENPLWAHGYHQKLQTSSRICLVSYYI